MAINRETYQAELAARKSKSLHLNLQTSLLQLHGRQQHAVPKETRTGFLITLRILAAFAVLTGIYFLFF